MLQKKYILNAPGDLSVEENHLDTENLKATELAAVTHWSAVSVGTEMAAYRGDPPLRPTASPYPRLVGYCNVAEIISVGSAVSTLVPGDFILTGQCHCSGFICEEETIFGKICATSDLRLASTAYLFHLGYTSFRSAGLTTGQSVAVIGLGPLGIAAVACSKMLGLHATGISNQSDSLKLVEIIGETASKKDGDLPAGSFNGVLVTSNSWKDWELAMEIVADLGAIMVLGFPGRGEPLPGFNPLDSKWLYDKQLRISGVGRPESREALKTNISTLLENIDSGVLNPQPMISRDVSWNELPELYSEMAEDRKGICTAVLNWKQ